MTAEGETLGNATAPGQPQVDVLSVGGKTYVRPPNGSRLSDLPTGVSPTSVAGKWVTGSELPAKLVPAEAQPPHQLADRLMRALDRATAFPRIGASPIQVGADQAYEVATPDGTLAVSATTPYRVLRWIPRTTDQQTSTSTPVEPTAGGGVNAVVDQSQGPIVFTVMTPADREQAFNDVIAQTQTLTDAVDVGVQFNFQQSGDLKCTNDSCTVSATVSTVTTAAQGARLSGNVSAVMRASLTIDGQPSSGCSTTQTLPINGSSVMACVDGSVAPIIAGINARNQAKVDAQARAENRDITVDYPIDIRSHVDVQASAMVQAEIDRLVTTVRAEQGSGRTRDTCGQSCTYRQIPYGSENLSQAADSARRSRNTPSGANLLVAVVPGWNDPQNGDLILGSGDSQGDNPVDRSEEDLLSQLTAKGYKPDQITSLFSERQPCFATCGSKLAPSLRPDTIVSYSIPWLPNDSQAAAAANNLLGKLAVETPLPHT
ncbi:nucleic acid/nucleotide deaminase domain-containing protein [Nocardia heshunensis]